MSFNFDDIQLPITSLLPEVRSTLSTSNTLIVHAPPGAGKSTLLPLALLGEYWLHQQKIIVLEPRRLAAKSIAHRMADLLGEKIGQRIGYRIRFESKVSDETRIEVVTEGILTRMLQNDNALERVGAVIFDEFHERNIHADVALALCRETQEIIRPELKIVLMSATLDTDSLSQLLQAPVLKSEGRQYPVDIQYMEGKPDVYLLPELIAEKVKEALHTQEGDILVFLPGQAEITKCEAILKRSTKGVCIHPLYGQLPHKLQQLAIVPNREGKRKVVLSTSIAETSLTIEGVTIVIDSGYVRTQKFDPNSGLSRLETVQITKDAADQRAGRAGRLAPGVCFRMWSKATQGYLQEHRVPEIEASDLASLALEMANWGVKDIQTMTWLTPPPTGAVAQAHDLLHEIGALEEHTITAHGKEIHKVPCHPRIAHMLLEAQQQDILPLATDLAALLEERDPLSNAAGIDINSRIEALRRFRSTQAEGRKMSRIEKVAASYRKLFSISPDNGHFDPFDTGWLIATAYPERIAFNRPGNNAQFQMANGRLAMAGHKDDLAWEQWLAIAHLNARDGMGKIFLASPLNPKDLQPLVKQVETLQWDAKKGGLIASNDMRIGNIVLQSIPIHQPNPEKVTRVLIDVLRKEGKHLLDWNEKTENWQHRMTCLRHWYPEENWPDVTIGYLLEHLEEWLSPYLAAIRKPEDLKKIDLYEVLSHSIPFDLQQKAQELAPEKIQVASGSSIKIAYQPGGKPPILSVRLQEMFGTVDTPTVNKGQIPLLLHLLSPGFKPVQITSDLASFWKNTYFEVKKELKRRYPKHHWPDNPLDAEAVRGVKRKK